MFTLTEHRKEVPDCGAIVAVKFELSSLNETHASSLQLMLPFVRQQRLNKRSIPPICLNLA
jgi:hypothetical protein